MAEIKSIHDFYDHAENHDRSWVFDSNCCSALSKLIKSKIDVDNSKLLTWEKALFNYSITKGELVPIFSETGQNGEIISYPNMD